jgi:fructokinase
MAAGSHTLCLGEVVVDLICERHLSTVGEVDAFVPHFGGAPGNVAIAAARAGARVAFAGGAGDDVWGRWLRDRLATEGVDVSLFELLPGAPTPLALITVDDSGDAHYNIYGDTIEGVLTTLADRLERAVEAAAALYLSSNTLVGDPERAVTMHARDRALERGRPVIFDPNLRLQRWRSHADAAASANACVPGALLVRCTEAEATLMTGEYDPERAATALLKAGARLVAITLGSRGAILRGEERAEARGLDVAVRSTIGAGDAVTGTLLARLAATGFYPAAAAAGLPDAVAAGAAACGRWGALD